MIKYIVTFFVLFSCVAAAQTIKSLGYNTNGQIVYSGGTNALTFTNPLQFESGVRAATRTNLGGTTVGNAVFTATNAATAATTIGLGTTNSPTFSNLTLNGTLGVSNAATFATNVSVAGSLEVSNAAATRTNLGGTTVGNAVFTATNAAAAASAVGLGATNDVLFDDVQATSFLVGDATNSQIAFEGNSAAITRTNLNLGATWLTNTDATNFRTAIGLGTAATNPSTAFQPSSANLTNLAANNGGSLTNLTAANIVGTVGLASNITGTAPLASNVTGIVALANGGTGATNAAAARTSLGATTVGASLFTLPNPNALCFLQIGSGNGVTALTSWGFRTAIGLGTTDTVTFTRANIGTTDGNLLWFGVPAQLSVQGTDGRHAIIAHAPAGGGAAVIGTSSSGSAAGKFYQGTTYTSPALWVSRQTASTNSATLGIGAGDDGPQQATAVSVSHGTNEVFFVRHDGAVSSLYQRFGIGPPEGVVSAPVGAVYHRINAGAGSRFFVKESGGTGNTGWVAK